MILIGAIARLLSKGGPRRAYDPVTRRTIAWVLGGRDNKTLRRLLDKVGVEGRTFVTGDWEGYHRVILEDRHFTGKDLTFSIEQDNSDIRHFLARCRRRTGFATLDRPLARLHANKVELLVTAQVPPWRAQVGTVNQVCGHACAKKTAPNGVQHGHRPDPRRLPGQLQLLMVLDRPDIPLHTNGSENDIRSYVTRRKVGAGTRSDDGRDSRDAFPGLSKTRGKPGIPVWNYLGNRLKVAGHAMIKALHHYVGTRTRYA